MVRVIRRRTHVGDCGRSDIRPNPEYAKEHIPGAINIPLHELAKRLDDLPAGPVWVHCGSGYRAIATSLLNCASVNIVLINDTFVTGNRA